MTFLQRLFGKRSDSHEGQDAAWLEREDLNESLEQMARGEGAVRVAKDMRDEPVDAPLDYREDGTIREGDPAWAFMQEVLQTGSSGLAVQNPDGTWTAELSPRAGEAEAATQPVTPVLIYNLAPTQIENITFAYHQASRHGAYVSGKAALSAKLGDNMDQFDLEVVEDAARHVSTDPTFHSAITWAYMAYTFPDELARAQRDLLTRPWTSR